MVEARGQFENPEGGNVWRWKPFPEDRYVKIHLTEKTLCALVICRAWKIEVAL
jgi:hypothetical protein